MMMFQIRTNAKQKCSDFYQNYSSVTYFDFRIKKIGPKLWPPKFGPSNQKMWDPPNVGPPIQTENLSWKINPCEKLARELGPNHPYEPDAEPN